ncbi:hypothetical protein [Methanosarcina siciliae]|uniref:hypothetical protein n=1 Tax=Methanosarcina siciliae TaxID=38027 RepID=UPI0036F23F26
MNFGARAQAVSFKFPSAGNYREELHGKDNLMGVSAGEDVQLNIPGNYGRIWTLET